MFSGPCSSFGSVESVSHADQNQILVFLELRMMWVNPVMIINLRRKRITVRKGTESV